MIALRFTEWMNGRVALGEDDYDCGHAKGEPMALRLQLSLADLDAFIRSRDRLLDADGEVRYAPLGGRIAAHGRVKQLPEDGDPRHKTMPYALDLDLADRKVTLHALKRVDPPFADSWKDTTTLYVRLEEGGETIGAGIVHIHFLQFLRQFITYHVSGGNRAIAIVRFYTAFLGRLWEVYGFR